MKSKSRSPSIPPRESGEGGPRSCAVGGALESTLVLLVQNILHRPRPLHHTSCGPPPPLSRGRMQTSDPVPAVHPRPAPTRSKRFRLQRGTFIFASPIKRGKRSADWRVTRELHLLPGTAEILLTRTPRLSALHCGLTRLSSRPGLGHASWNHRMQTAVPSLRHSLSSASAASTWQSEHAPDGLMPRPSA